MSSCPTNCIACQSILGRRVHEHDLARRIHELQDELSMTRDEMRYRGDTIVWLDTQLKALNASTSTLGKEETAYFRRTEKK